MIPVRLLRIQVLPQNGNQLLRLLPVTTRIIQFGNELFLAFLFDSEHFLKCCVFLLVFVAEGG
jgi:hypothetical protein